MNYPNNLKFKENEGTPKKTNLNQNFYYREEKVRDSFKKRNDEISLLITNFPDKYYKYIIMEFSKYGNIKNIFYDYRKFTDSMIIEYENSEIAHRVAESINVNFLQKYDIYDRIKINLLSEQEKFRFLEKMLSSDEIELNTSIYNTSQRFTFSPNKTYNHYNKGHTMTIQHEKSNWKKFTDVFFNF
jgi:hypothetical protein